MSTTAHGSPPNRGGYPQKGVSEAVSGRRGRPAEALVGVDQLADRGNLPPELLVHGALEFGAPAADIAGDELDDVRGDRYGAFLRLRREDRDPRVQVRRRQVRDESPFEPAPQPLLERQDRLGRPVRAQDDLLAVLVD